MPSVATHALHARVALQEHTTTHERRIMRATPLRACEVNTTVLGGWLACMELNPLTQTCCRHPCCGNAQNLVVPRRRYLGMRWKATLGTDGEMNGPPVKVFDYCWDLPIDETLKRWFRDCPRVLADVLAFQERMHRRATETPGFPTGPEVITLVDLCDGHIYRDHGALGDEARRRSPTHYQSDPNDPSSPLLPSRFVLSLVFYYDDVEPANSLGHARIIHKMGCFYYALVDLSQGSRQQLHFITPFTMANAKDVTRYGPKVLVGDPSSGTYHTCTCAAATLKRMSDRAIEPTVWNLSVFDQTLPIRIEAYVLAFSGDHPAQAVVGYGMRSVSARMFDRRSMLDKNDPKWTEPSAFLVGENTSLPHRWQLRSQTLLADHLAQYLNILAKEGDGAAVDYLRSKGYNTDWRFDYAMKAEHFPYFDETTSQPVDPMHIYLVSSGLCGHELASFLYLANNLGAFTVEQFNACLSARRFNGVRLPPLHESVKEGQAGGLPNRAAHTHWTAGHMLAFMPSSLEVLQPLIDAGRISVQQRLDATLGTAAQRATKRQKLTDKLADFERAWVSWKALHSEFSAVFATSFSLNSTAAMERLIYHHQSHLRAVRAYRDAETWKPKHNFAQLIPVDVRAFAVIFGFWCMRFEAMNKTMKRFATSGDYSDVCYRSLQMWDLSIAWSLSSGNFSSTSTTESKKESMGTVATFESAIADGDDLIAKLFSFSLSPELEYYQVFEVLHMGQYLSPQTWILTESWHQWIRDSSPMLACIDRMVRLDSGEIYVRANVLPGIVVSQYWISETTLRIPLEALWESPKLMDFLIDENAITPLQHCLDHQEPEMYSAFKVQRSMHN